MSSTFCHHAIYAPPTYCLHSTFMQSTRCPRIIYKPSTYRLHLHAICAAYIAYSCYLHTVCMSSTLHLHSFFMPATCRLHTVYMASTCCLQVVYMATTCHVHADYMLPGYVPHSFHLWCLHCTSLPSNYTSCTPPALPQDILHISMPVSQATTQPTSHTTPAGRTGMLHEMFMLSSSAGGPENSLWLYGNPGGGKGGGSYRDAQPCWQGLRSAGSVPEWSRTLSL